MSDKNEQGQCSQEPACIFLDENGKHPWTVWHHNHRPGYKFWVPTCPHCGYVNTEGIMEELERNGLMTRSNSPDSVKLEKLDEKQVMGAIVSEFKKHYPYPNVPTEEMDRIIAYVEAICQRFGTVKVPTVEVISKVLIALHEVTGEVYLGDITSTSEKIQQLLTGGAEK